MTRASRTAYSTASATDPLPQEQKVRPSLDLALAIGGAVCGALITAALPGDSSSVLKLVGAAIGAAVPPFVTTIGKWRHLRATAAVVVTIAALGLTYVGSFFVDAATGSETSTFPAPRWGPAATTSTQQHVSTTQIPPVLDVGIDVAPKALTCNPKCDSKVTIRSIGVKPLVVAAIEFDGPARARFKQTGACAQKQFVQDEACSFEVTFSPAGTSGKQVARLVINQNLPGPASFVDLTGEGPASGLDLVPLADNVECAFQPAGTAGGKDAIQVFFRLSMTGAKPADLFGLVPVVARSNSGAITTFSTAVSQNPNAVVVAALPLTTGDYDRPHAITITVDPENKIAETDETNNQLQVSTSLLGKPKSTTPLDCRAV
jgi:hypothetical protein